ncbi:MAG: 4a-hydroxytetrahydrobiopterin dehydratase [Candidatus Limnocylindrales bacterium]
MPSAEAGRARRSAGSEPILVAPEDLAGERCEACTGATPRIGPQEGRELATALDASWQISETALQREFRFKSFNAAFGLATRVALLAESEGHHPDLEIGWGRLLVRFTTHAIGGLSRNDFISAAKVDRIHGGEPGPSGL